MEKGVLRELAGWLLFLAAAQFLPILYYASTRFPDPNSLTISYILYREWYAGVSLGFAGIMVIIASIAVESINRLSRIMLGVAGIAAVLISVFNISYLELHIFFTALFLVSGISAMLFLRTDRYFRLFSLGLGTVAAIGAVLFIARLFNSGIAERIAVYPIIIWGAALGIHLLWRD